MTTTGIIAATIGAWTVLACLGSAGFSLVASRLKRAKPTAADDTRWLPFMPPVPPPAPRVDDDWLDLLPADCLSRDEIDRRFFRLVKESTR